MHFEFGGLLLMCLASGITANIGDCNFDHGNLCGWEDLRIDTFDWRLKQGNTGTSGTGPSHDHTGGRSGKYIYIESSVPRRVGDTAMLRSPQFNVASETSQCMNVWYNMYGPDIGTLAIYTSHGDSAKQLLWTLSGNQGTEWKLAQVDIQSYLNYAIVLEATRGNSYRGDIAVDDISFTDGLCDSRTTTDNGNVDFTTENVQTFDKTQAQAYTDEGYTTSLYYTTYPWWTTNNYMASTAPYYQPGTTARYYDTTIYHRESTTYYPWWLHLSTLTDFKLENAIHVDCDEYDWSIVIDMGRLKQMFPGANPQDIYLGENRCTGTEHNGHLTFKYSLTECLTTDTVRGDVNVYNNELIYAEHDPVDTFIIKHYNWTVGVECDVNRDGSVSSNVSENVESSTPAPDAYQRSENMSFYLDPNFVNQVSSDLMQVSVGQDVYVKVFTTTPDWSTKMRVHTCYAKPSKDSPEHLRYYLIKNGCEVDSNTHLISQSTHETRFVFENFEYSSSSHDGIYVTCDVTFCGTSDYSRGCLQTCNPVVKRSAPRVPVN